SVVEKQGACHLAQDGKRRFVPSALRAALYQFHLRSFGTQHGNRIGADEGVRPFAPRVEGAVEPDGIWALLPVEKKTGGDIGNDGLRYIEELNAWQCYTNRSFRRCRASFRNPRCYSCKPPQPLQRRGRYDICGKLYHSAGFRFHEVVSA